MFDSTKQGVGTACKGRAVGKNTVHWQEMKDHSEWRVESKKEGGLRQNEAVGQPTWGLAVFLNITRKPLIILSRM